MKKLAELIAKKLVDDLEFEYCLQDTEILIEKGFEPDFCPIYEELSFFDLDPFEKDTLFYDMKDEKSRLRKIVGNNLNNYSIN